MNTHSLLEFRGFYIDLFLQDAVVKGTYDLLPGCATIVLETVLSLQSYAMSKLSADNGSSLANSRYQSRIFVPKNKCYIPQI